MPLIVTIVHVFVSLFLVLTVLLQAGKGGGMGATFGGGSSQGSVFGGSGAGNFLSRLTTISAVIFMMSSMTLAYLASTSGEDSLKTYSAQMRQAHSVKDAKDKEAIDSFNEDGSDSEDGNESGDSESGEPDESSPDSAPGETGGETAAEAVLEATGGDTPVTDLPDTNPDPGAAKDKPEAKIAEPDTQAVPKTAPSIEPGE